MRTTAPPQPRCERPRAAYTGGRATAASPFGVALTVEGTPMADAATPETLAQTLIEHADAVRSAWLEAAAHELHGRTSRGELERSRARSSTRSSTACAPAASRSPSRRSTSSGHPRGRVVRTCPPRLHAPRDRDRRVRAQGGPVPARLRDRRRHGRDPAAAPRRPARALHVRDVRSRARGDHRRAGRAAARALDPRGQALGGHRRGAARGDARLRAHPGRHGEAAQHARRHGQRARDHRHHGRARGGHPGRAAPAQDGRRGASDGAECTISGIRPQIAQTIVALGIEFGDIRTRATLADALVDALRASRDTRRAGLPA